MDKTTHTPWSWIPSLYFAQGMPYVVVMTVSVIMFKRLGMSNTDIALYTSGLNLPKKAVSVLHFHFLVHNVVAIQL